ncbi:TPA: MucBP domain-containing protein, partial [Streptococcus suis]
MKRKKSFDWYGARQRFSIRTYHFGAASVLLGLTLATGAQAVQAEELVADTTVTSSIQSPATTDTTPALTTETATQVERTATIDYVVNYVLEDGTLVNAVVKTATVTTTEVVASTSVDVAVEVPAGYELAQGQATTVTQVVTEGAENLVTVQLVKKAEVAAPTTEAATEAPTTITEAATETPATTTEVAAPVTVEEAKVVLEQNISEAVVLSDEANRLYAAAPEGNESLKAAADATKLTVTEATTVLKDSVATLVQVNAQIDAVRTNVEALALELRKFLGTEDIQVSLAVAAGASIGSGTGVLVEAQSTKPSMDNPNGASVASKTEGTMTGTTVANYYTFHYAALSSWYDAVRTGFYPYGFTPDKKPTNEEVNANPLKYGKTDSAYFRASATADPATSPILVELVTKDGVVLESNYLNVGDSANFTTFQPTSGANLPIVVSFVGETQTASTAGTLSFQFDNNTIQPNILVPRLEEFHTYYRVEGPTNDLLATYTMVTQPGLVNTTSGVRDIPGYAVVKDSGTGLPKTTEETVSYLKYAETSYVDQTRDPDTSPIGSKFVATPVGTDGTVTKGIYLIDPASGTTPSYTLISPDGFMKLMESSEMAPGATNTNLLLNPELLTKYKVMQIPANTIGNLADDAVNTGTVITDPAQFTLENGNIFEILLNPNALAGELYVVRVRALAADGSRLQTHWIRKANAGEQVTVPQDLAKITEWDKVLQGQPGDANVTPYTAADGKTYYPILDQYGNPQGIQLTYAGYFQTYSVNNNPVTVTVRETTYWYTPIPQEAIIRYQVEGEAGYLEDSGTLTGNPGTDITYSTEDTINKYKKLGYDLVSDNFTTKAGQDYDYDETVKQEFLVVIKPRIVDVPKTAVPGEPVDPTDPNSPVWPDTLKNLEATQEVTRTVEYKYEDGTPVRVDAAGNVLPKGSTEGTPFVKTETVTFTRPAQVNLVTGEVTYGEWAADTTDTLKGNVLPQVPGYTASRTTLEGADAPMSETVIPKKVAATDADINEVVYYTPNPKYGDVVVNYVNTDGKVIANPVVDTNDALVGTDYSTADQVPEKIVEDATGDVYYYKEIKPEDATKETGTVVEGTTEVTYVYEKAGDVVIKYVDVNGLELQAPVADTTDGKPGSDYNTAEGTEKPATITTGGKVYALVPAGDYPVGTVAADSNLASGATPTGTVEAGVTKEVTYVYQEVKSDVVVEYYDTEGNPISGTETGNATSVVDTEDASVGTAYNTDDKKPATITAADGTVYYYKEVKDTSAPTTGTVAETTTTVQYVYEKAGDVIVHYITTDGTPISGVTNTGSVTASTVDDTVNGKPGSTYDTSDLRPTTITTDEGKTYELVPTATIGDESGKVESGVTKEVTYVYKEVKGSVVVNYISTTGEELQAQVVDTPESSTGTEYDTTDVKPETITTKDGRTFKLVPKMTQGTEKGEVVPGVTEVTYVYEEVKGDVVVNYVNTDGKVIATQVVDTKTTSTGTAYDTTDNKPEKIVEDATGDVYYYKEVQAGSNETGKVVEGTTEVTYVYEKAGNVVVNYITEDGTVIKAPVNDETDAKPGSDYNTTDNKPTEIVTEDGSRYVLIPSKTIGSETGTVEGGKTTEITYVYKKVATWIPQIPGVPAGEEPKVPYPFDPENPDKPIDPTTPYPNNEVPSIPHVPGYTPIDPKTNEPLKPVDPTDPSKGYVPPTPDESGIDTPIPYVQNGNVVVNYVTEDGTPIKAPVQ